MAVSDFILEIKGIEGETADDKHKDKGIDILSFSWGVSNSSTFNVGGGGGSGKSHFDNLTVMKASDKASPKLAQACAGGKHLEQAILHVRKAGDGQQEYYTITLTDVLVSSFQASAGGQEVTESVSLAYAKIKWDYKPQGKDGILAAAIPFGYDVKANKAV